MGKDDGFVKRMGGRVEIFEIAADEQLIGAEICHGTETFSADYGLSGVTFLKCKIFK